MLADYFEPFVQVHTQLAPDGLGGYLTTYTEGQAFQGGIGTRNSNEYQVAYQNGLKTVYRITTGLDICLNHDDLVRRQKDGRLYRITGNAADYTTPAVASDPYRCVTAELMEP